jgi:type I restriction enzyme S subunit
MANEWRTSTIGSLCDAGVVELQTGPFGSQLHAYDYASEGVPVVPTEAIRARRIDHSVLPKISHRKAEELSRHRLRLNDILFARRGIQATGHIGFVREPEVGFLCGTGAIRLRVAQNRGAGEVDPDFLSHVLADSASIKWFKFHAIGATMPNLNEGIIRSFPLRLPPLAEQRAIAHILNSLDDKVELNRRMSETLEAMARALFKSWFVDFDAVRAKAEGRDTGLPRNLADLFPDRLVESKIGEIPEGWPVETLADHCEAVKGVSYKGSGLGKNGMPLHNLNSIYEGGGYKYEGIKYYSGEYADRHTVLPGDVIVANTEQGHNRLLIGYAALVPAFFGDQGIASHHIFRLRPNHQSPLTAAYLCWLLNSPQMHDVVSGYANGTTVNMLPLDGIQKPAIVRPPETLVTTFDSVARHAACRCEQVVSESLTLASLRDTLLPKLISGELRVPEVMKAIEEAAA